MLKRAKGTESFKKLSIVIPVYNEEDYIKELLYRVLKVKISLRKEIIIVDDYSSDKSFEICTQFSKQYRHKNFNFTIIRNTSNLGKSASLKRGFLASSGDIVMVQDADLEYNPEDYNLILEPFLLHGADVVYGSRFISNRPHRVLYFWHYVANISLTVFSNIFTNLNLTDIETGYKCFKGDLIRKIAPKLVTKGFGFEPEITSRISKIKNLKIFEVGISYYGRTYDEGKKITWKDGFLSLWDVVRFNLFT